MCNDVYLLVIQKESRMKNDRFDNFMITIEFIYFLERAIKNISSCINPFQVTSIPL